MSEIWRFMTDSPLLKNLPQPFCPSDRHLENFGLSKHIPNPGRKPVTSRIRLVRSCSAVSFCLYVDFETRKMSVNPNFVSPFHRPRCLSAAAPAGKLTHPGKAILAGEFLSVHNMQVSTSKSSVCIDWLQISSESCAVQFLHGHAHCLQLFTPLIPHRITANQHHSTGEYSVCVCVC